MILIINMCAHELHEVEFVQPVVRCLPEHDRHIIHYLDLDSVDPHSYEGIIICGTALKDNEFLNHLESFQWLKECNVPTIGICAGMEVIAKVFGAELIEQKEIGLTRTMIHDEEVEVYTLHSFGVTCPKGFEVIAQKDTIIHGIKKDNITAYLFHPEVRNQDLIRL